MKIFGELQYFLQNDESKKYFMYFLEHLLNIKFKSVVFNGLEEFKSISEYDFYLISFIGITENNIKKEIFIKRVKKGKIKESLFCICDLAYNKYFENHSNQKNNNLRKIAIIEQKKKINHINTLSINLYKDSLKNERIIIQIYFIDMSYILNELKNKERLEDNIEINQKDIIMLCIKDSD